MVKYKNYLYEGWPGQWANLGHWEDGKIHYGYYGEIIGVMKNGKEVEVKEVKDIKEEQK